MPGRPPPFTTLVLHTWREHGKPRPWDKREDAPASPSTAAAGGHGEQPPTPHSARVVSLHASRSEGSTASPAAHISRHAAAGELAGAGGGVAVMGGSETALSSMNASGASTPGGKVVPASMLLTRTSAPGFSTHHYRAHQHSHHTQSSTAAGASRSSSGHSQALERRQNGAYELRNTFSMTQIGRSTSQKSLASTSEMRRVQSIEGELFDQQVLGKPVPVTGTAACFRSSMSCDSEMTAAPVLSHRVLPAAGAAGVVAERRGAALAMGTRSPGLSAVAFDMFEDDGGDDFGTGHAPRIAAAYPIATPQRQADVGYQWRHPCQQDPISGKLTRA
uniref:Uncharacterized protein n=1 Tax=Erythrolobus australicus TaxID=1077150 RepID=A0A7S1XHI7_9RHOD|mmetsp:Transcript_2932/g.8057  ORF Transcript_2932/g.8057 Transcript_2932/m.8057 type:complete len:333 (+) Transcript_2932:235-1233(+)